MGASGRGARARVAVLGAMAALPLAGCALMRPNPEARACTAACVDAKNTCLLGATTTEAVGRCDQEHRQCMQPCLAMPRYVGP